MTRRELTTPYTIFRYNEVNSSDTIYVVPPTGWHPGYDNYDTIRPHVPVQYRLDFIVSDDPSWNDRVVVLWSPGPVNTEFGEYCP